SRASSQRSVRMSGSPPEKTRIGLPVSGSERMNSSDCAVFMSLLESSLETSSRRQWMHARLQPVVVSQKTSRSDGGGGASVSSRSAGAGAGLLRVASEGYVASEMDMSNRSSHSL